MADTPLVDLAGTHECTLELEGYVPAGDGWLEYLAVEGATPSEVLATMEETVTGQGGRVLTGGTDGGRIAVSVSSGALVAVASTMGVTVADARAGPTAARAVLEVPGDADARAVATQFQREYPAAELVANSSREGTPDAGGRPEGPLGTLTDRQREVLIAAHRAGYFEWPRDSTAAELADDLNIDRSTLHGHLRKAQDRIVSTLLDGEDAVRPTR